MRKKRYRVEFSASADQDVQTIRDRIARDRPKAAAKWVLTLHRQVRLLKQFPFLFEVIPEAERVGIKYRHLLHGDYRTIYEVQADRVFIHRVIHGSQLLSKRTFTPPSDQGEAATNAD